MVLCMKTTVVINDSLLRRAKNEAARRRSSVRSLIEEGLRRVLDRPDRKKGSFRLQWTVETGRKVPPVDPADRRALHDFLDSTS